MELSDQLCRLHKRASSSMQGTKAILPSLPILVGIAWSFFYTLNNSFVQDDRHKIFYNIAVIECPGGTDKGSDGHRKDSHYLVNGLKNAGADSKIFVYTDDTADDVYDAIFSYADAYVSRVDPGEYESCSEEKYFGFLQRLIKRNIIPFNTPHDMLALGSKRSLLHLNGMYFYPNNTFLYSSQEEFKALFPKTLRDSGSRVLKQNRGSKGEGVWWVNLIHSNVGDLFGNITSLELVKAVEAKDNHREILSLADFSERVIGKYLKTPNDFVIDMEFLPRISEGEVRLVLAGREVLFVVDKRPPSSILNEDSFSANLGAGALHVWQPPSNWEDLVKPFLYYLDEMLVRLGVDTPPILWTVDFIRYGEAGSSQAKFVISEINASCVGFSAHPELAEKISEILLKAVQDHSSRIPDYSS